MVAKVLPLEIAYFEVIYTSKSMYNESSAVQYVIVLLDELILFVTYPDPLKLTVVIEVELGD